MKRTPARGFVERLANIWTDVESYDTKSKAERHQARPVENYRMLAVGFDVPREPRIG